MFQATGNMERQNPSRQGSPLDLPIGSKIPPILLYFHPSMKGLAEEISKRVASERKTKMNEDEVDVNLYTFLQKELSLARKSSAYTVSDKALCRNNYAGGPTFQITSMAGKILESELSLTFL